MGTGIVTDQSLTASFRSGTLPRGEAGYSLMEMIVAFFVLGIALAGFSLIAVTTTAGNTESDDRATATALAIQKIEEFRGLSFQELDALQAQGPADPEGPLNAKGEIDAEAGTFSRSYTITDNTTLGALDANDVAVTVSWTGGAQVQVATTIADPNISSPTIFHQAFPTVSVRSWTREK